ncbi:ring-box protein 1a [Quercus suber]|uniref:Ring-box protein 1a n=1 Tax=Quercus suber TaxID=58331 RepID=A0AAW0KLX2_QUESU
METDADTDVTMVPANTEPEAEPASSSSALLASSSSSSFKKNNKRFEIKKWNAVSLWAWDIVVDNCAICRNHIMDLYNSEWEFQNMVTRTVDNKNTAYCFFCPAPQFLCSQQFKVHNLKFNAF